MNFMEILHRFIPVDEAVWDVIKSFFRVGTEKVVEQVRNDDVRTARRAVFLLWSDKLNELARKNWREVWKDPAFKPHRQKVEVALENGLERLEERKGIFPETVEPAKTTTTSGGKDKPPIVTKVEAKLKECEGYGGRVLFIAALNEAGTSPDEVKAFIEAITDQSIFERAQEQIGEAVKKHWWKVVAFFAVWIILMIFLLWAMVFCFSSAINNPDESLGSFLWGLFWLIALAYVSDPWLRLILPQS